MGLFGLAFETRYPVFGFDGGMRAMSSDEILQMQLNQQRAMQNAWTSSWAGGLSSLGMAAYQPPQRPLDDRFAEFKKRLAETVAKYPALTASPATATPAG